MSADLQARVRLEAALEPLGVELISRSPDGVLPEPQPDLVVLDLDALGSEGAARWAALASPGPRLVGFFSHVDKQLGEEAQVLGIESYRRGRFWSAAREILARPKETDS